MTYTARHPRRLAAMLLALVVFLTGFVAPAPAQAGWDQLTIRLSWIDANGGAYEAYAAPVGWSQDQSYWVQVNADAPLSALTLNIHHPNHAYSFDPADGATLMNVVDAGTEMNAMAVIPISAFADGQWVTTYNLYVSTRIAMPEQPQAKDATITVYYVDEATNAPFATDYVTVAGDSSATIAPKAEFVGGYEPVNANPVDVYVSFDGVASQNEVWFVYRQPQAKDATITVYYVDEATNTPFATDYVTVAGDSSATIAPKAEFVGGYEPVNANPVDVTVSFDGVASQNEVWFVYRQPQAKDATITVYYVDEATNAPFATDYVTVAGDSSATIAPKAEFVGGYEPVNANPVDVYVSFDGVASQNEVWFVYRQPQAKDATITVYYVDEATNAPFATDYVTVAGDSSATIAPKAEFVGGYEPVNANPVDVTVSFDGVASQNEVWFVYRHPQAKDATITVYYVDEATNAPFATDYVTVAGDSSATIAPKAEFVGGYEPVNANPVDVTVSFDGVASQNEVWFVYRQPQAKDATITVYYVDEATNAPFATDYVTVAGDSSATIAPKAEFVGGHEPVNANPVDVYVSFDGVASQNEVWFVYRQPQVAPMEAIVVAYYVDEATGQAFYTDYVTLPGGATTTVSPKEELYAGYETVSAAPVEISVTAEGVPSQNEVWFTFRKPEIVPVDATITVYYVDEAANAAFATDAVTAKGGATTTVAPKEELYAGYEIISAAPVEISVTAEGVPSQNEVWFTFRKPEIVPVDATITVYYVDEAANAAFATDAVTAKGGATTTVAPKEELYSGYEIVSAAPVEISVTAEGVPSQNEVWFTFRKPEIVPVDATITVYYVDEAANAAFATDAVTAKGGATTTVAPKEELYAGYEIVSAAPVEISVTAEGVASQNEVWFTFRKPEIVPVDAIVTVYYIDISDREPFATDTVTCKGGQTTAIAPRADLTDGYAPVDAAPVNVTVTVEGQADRADVTFAYEKIVTPTPPPATVDVSVRYVNEAGQDIVAPFAVTLPCGQTSQLAPDPALVPDPYDPQSAAAVSVTVGVDGVVEPSVVVFTFAEKEPPETPIPNGSMINRFGTITKAKTALRDAPGKENSKIVKRLAKGTAVYMLRVETNAQGEAWARVLIDGEQYYISADCIQAMSQKDSDRLMASELETPVPPFTSEQLDNPGQPTEQPTDEPTASPAPPTASPEPEQYIGYALTTRAIALRNVVNGGDDTIVRVVNANELVMITGQVYDQATGAWSMATALDTSEGYLPDSSLRRINNEEAEYYLRQWQEAHPTATPTAAPTEVPAQYVGYALIQQTVALRTGISTADEAVIRVMPANELVMVYGQEFDPTGEAWSQVMTLDQVPGYVPDASLRRINEQEAKYYLDQWAASQATPTPDPVTPAPMKFSGYFVTVGDGVYFRQQADYYASIIDILDRDIVVYVRDQEYVEGVAWHVVQFNGEWGYIRADMLRQMTVEEENAFLENQNPSEPPAADTPEPYNPDSLSSYGYVQASSVNFRKEPTTSSGKISTLRQYALCMVTDTVEKNDGTWYKVKYGGKEGYVSGKYFRHMTMSEMAEFIDSEEYFKGLQNNSASAGNNQDNTQFSGGIVAPEDQTVDKWVNPNSGISASYEPFNPFGTPAPIVTNTPTLAPMVTIPATTNPVQSLAPLQTQQVTDLYPTDSGNNGGASIFGWIIGFVVVAMIGAGVYGYASYTRNKREAAQRAAARRAQAAAQQRGEARPYARQGAAQPRTSTNAPRPGAQRPGQRPAPSSPQRPPQPRSPYAAPAQDYTRPTAQPNPYSRPAAPAPEAQPEAPNDFVNTPEAPVAPRAAGRRAAYRAAQQGVNDAPVRAEAPAENTDFSDDSGNSDF